MGKEKINKTTLTFKEKYMKYFVFLSCVVLFLVPGIAVSIILGSDFWITIESFTKFIFDKITMPSFLFYSIGIYGTIIKILAIIQTLLDLTKRK